MHKTAPIILLAFAGCLLACNPAKSRRVAQSNTSFDANHVSEEQSAIEGRVVRVHDGDTIFLEGSDSLKYSIRLAGIDAPELSQPYGRSSGTELAKFILNKDVIVHYQKRDRYGRIVGKVLLDGRDICLDQVTNGSAWHFKRYESEQTPGDRLAYAGAEEKARNSKLGLWADPSPQPPWEAPSRARAMARDAFSSPQAPNINDNISSIAPVRGNRRSMVYHRQDCPDHDRVSPHNRVYFSNSNDAERAGYRIAGNCPK